MIFVRMAQNYAFESAFFLHQIADIGNDQIDAQQICAGKHKTAVDGDGCISMLEEHHVETKLA